MRDSDPGVLVRSRLRFFNEVGSGFHYETTSTTRSISLMFRYIPPLLTFFSLRVREKKGKQGKKGKKGKKERKGRKGGREGREGKG